MQQKKNATIDVFMIPQNWSFSMLLQYIFCVFLQQMQIRNHKMARPQETLEYRTHATQRARFTEKVHKPPLGVNVIDFELNGFNASR